MLVILPSSLLQVPSNTLLKLRKSLRKHTQTEVATVGKTGGVLWAAYLVQTWLVHLAHAEETKKQSERIFCSPAPSVTGLHFMDRSQQTIPCKGPKATPAVSDQNRWKQLRRSTANQNILETCKIRKAEADANKKDYRNPTPDQVVGLRRKDGRVVLSLFCCFFKHFHVRVRSLALRTLQML